eukprot:6193909-Pleurochrysis_carterae.AAC.2
MSELTDQPAVITATTSGFNNACGKESRPATKNQQARRLSAALASKPLQSSHSHSSWSRSRCVSMGTRAPPVTAALGRSACRSGLSAVKREADGVGSGIIASGDVAIREGVDTRSRIADHDRRHQKSGASLAGRFAGVRRCEYCTFRRSHRVAELAPPIVAQSCAHAESRLCGEMMAPATAWALALVRAPLGLALTWA